MKSELEETLALFIRAEGLPKPEREYMFAKSIGRRWRFDFAYPERKVAIECEGGTWSRGRHTRGSGFAKDCEKYNQAVAMDWKVLRFTKSMIESGKAIEMIKEVLDGK
jgi:very-short-patch-repair endonuclease